MSKGALTESAVQSSARRRTEMLAALPAVRVRGERGPSEVTKIGRQDPDSRVADRRRRRHNSEGERERERLSQNNRQHTTPNAESSLWSLSRQSHTHQQ